jgi:hypothetical protein
MKLIKSIYKLFLIITTTGLLFSSCFSLNYDFKGGVTIPPHIKTFSVQYFDNRAQLVEPTFSQQFTDELRQYIESNSSLKYVRGMGDIDFSGTITTYQITPQAFSSSGGQDQAAMTRFTIGVKASYTDVKEPDNDFEKTVSAYREFESTTSFTAVEESLSEELREEIIEQIFNSAFVKW